jgi:hypothetical protein
VDALYGRPFLSGLMSSMQEAYAERLLASGRAFQHSSRGNGQIEIYVGSEEDAEFRPFQPEVVVRGKTANLERVLARERRAVADATRHWPPEPSRICGNDLFLRSP